MMIIDEAERQINFHLNCFGGILTEVNANYSLHLFFYIILSFSLHQKLTH